jgi:hypothetical protein
MGSPALYIQKEKKRRNIVKGPSGMSRKIALLRNALLVAFVLFVYGFVLIRSLDESSRRSLQLRDDTDSADHVTVSMLVTAVNPATHELTAQISLRPQGALAQDEVIPAVNLKLVVNNVRGQQEFNFPKGQRMNRIEAVFPLNGEINRYPFDRYEATLWMLATTPVRKKQPRASDVPESTEGQAIQDIVGATALQQSAAVPLTIVLSASTPGLKFEGNISRQSSLKVTGIGLKIRRADSVISVSILLMVLMSALSWSVFAMVIKATTGPSTINLIPLSISISLIFGLPALRNVQPGVPAVGAFGDYVSFIWSEIVVGLSAVLIMWKWLLRSDAES